MTTTTHTPAPWVYYYKGSAFHIGGDFRRSKNPFVTMNYWDDADYGCAKDEAEANARLISAAPEMLEVLEEIKSRIKNHPTYADMTEDEEMDEGGDSAEFSYLVRLASAAIAKATGGAE